MTAAAGSVTVSHGAPPGGAPPVSAGELFQAAQPAPPARSASPPDSLG